MTSLDEFSRAPADMSGASDRLGWSSKVIDRLFGGIGYGRLRIVLPSGHMIEKRGRHHGPEATIDVRNWRMLRQVIAAGDIGFAEGFIDGDWTTPDLTAVIRFAAKNSEALAPAIEGGLPMRLFNRVKHLLNANTRRGSRRNIEAHYDLGNAFYKEWLDPSMLYSSAIFDVTTPTLEAAQQKKLETIAEKLDLSGGESILEIGCGWGALALHLAERRDATVTGITLSPSQLDWARHAAEASEVSNKIELSLQDYRDVQGQFDRIVSIEMFEAVGEAYWPSYFNTLKRCMKPGGRAVLQVISIEDKRFATYRNTTDFIRKYIFPGGFLPSDRVLSASVTAAGLKITATDHFGRSYARTLAEWRGRFEASWPTIAALGFDERFRRLWHYYLCYCEAGFEEGTIDVGLYTIEHDDERRRASEET